MEHHLGRVSISDWLRSYDAEWQHREQQVKNGGKAWYEQDIQSNNLSDFLKLPSFGRGMNGGKAWYEQDIPTFSQPDFLKLPSFGHGMNGGKDMGVPPPIPNLPDQELINMPDEHLEQMALDGNDLQRMKDRRDYLKHLLKMADKLRKEQKHKKDRKDREPEGGPGQKQQGVKGHGNAKSKPVETTITIVPPVENDEETVSPEQEAIKAQIRGRFIAIREEEDAKRARNAEENRINKINRQILELELRNPRPARAVEVAAAPSVGTAYLTKHPTTGSYYRNEAERKADSESFDREEEEAIDFLQLRARANLRAHLKREPTEKEVDAEVNRLNLRRVEAYARSLGSPTRPGEFSQATYGMKEK